MSVRLFEPPDSERRRTGGVALDYEAGVLRNREVFGVDAQHLRRVTFVFSRFCEIKIGKKILLSR